MHIHIVGIGGTFMGGLAALAQTQGHHVTGCDAQMYPPMSTQLEKLGITAVAGYDPKQLDSVAHGADMFVIGNALSRGNPLVEAILDRNLPYTSGPQWLAENILRQPNGENTRKVLAVAGTHGKTTTASMLAWILESAGFNPSFLIGGIPNGFNISARLTDSRFFVIEADEYDTAFFDKRPKFIHYRPHIVVLNNLEFDHADIFLDLAAIETQFHYFVRTVPVSGHLISNAESEALKRVLNRGVWSDVETFGESPASAWRLGSNNAVFYLNKNVGTLALPQLGRMNQMNALAALAAAYHAGIAVNKALMALAEFPGVARRMQIRAVVNNVTVYDDFAHHPTAIAETLKALRQQVGNARILAVFEPRSNTMKLGTMKAALPDSLRLADLVFCFSGGLDWDAQETLAPLGRRAQTYTDLDMLIAAIQREAQSGDHILIMSNGSFGGIHESMIKSLESAALNL